MLHRMELLSIDTRPIPFTPILCLNFQKIPNCGDLEGSFDACKELAQNMYKLLSFHYMLGSLICGYSMPLKFSALFFIP